VIRWRQLGAGARTPSATPVTIGNNGGGGVRIPAAYCGPYGLKTSHGRVGIRPTDNPANSVSVAGPLAANIVDLEIGYRIMAHPDAKLFSPAGTPSRRKKTLGIYKTWFDRAEPIVQQICQDANAYLTTTHDYTVVDITLPLIHSAQLAHALTILCETSSASAVLQAQRLRHLLQHAPPRPPLHRPPSPHPPDPDNAQAPAGPSTPTTSRTAAPTANAQLRNKGSTRGWRTSPTHGARGVASIPWWGRVGRVPMGVDGQWLSGCGEEAFAGVWV